MFFTISGFAVAREGEGSLPQGMEGLRRWWQSLCGESADRYADVNAFRKDLRRYVDGYSPMAEGEPEEEQLCFTGATLAACNLILGESGGARGGVVFVAKIESEPSKRSLPWLLLRLKRRVSKAPCQTGPNGRDGVPD